MRDRYGSVAMVGYGVTDAPALVAAGVAVAMGGRGTPVGPATADIGSMGDDFGNAVHLSRRTTTIIRQHVPCGWR